MDVGRQRGAPKVARCCPAHPGERPSLHPPSTVRGPSARPRSPRPGVSSRPHSTVGGRRGPVCEHWGSPADSAPRSHWPGLALGICESSLRGPEPSTGRAAATLRVRAPAHTSGTVSARAHVCASVHHARTWLGTCRGQAGPRQPADAVRLTPGPWASRVPRRAVGWAPHRSPVASPLPPCSRVPAARRPPLRPPDGHEPHQRPARVVDLGPGTLHVAPLLAGLEVLPPAAVRHLPRQQEAAGPGHAGTGGPADRPQTRAP